MLLKCNLLKYSFEKLYPTYELTFFKDFYTVNIFIRCTEKCNRYTKIQISFNKFLMMNNTTIIKNIMNHINS